MIYSLPYFQLFKLLVQLLHWFFALYHRIVFFLMVLGTKRQWVLLFTSRFISADQSSAYPDILIQHRLPKENLPEFQQIELKI